MKLVSMKREKPYVNTMASPNPYGYGLCLSLNSEQCEALGIASPPPAGTVVSVQAIAVVQSVTESVDDDAEEKGEGGSNDVSLSLQITDMGVSLGGQDPNPAETLYGKKS
jgi:hypothetical protein